MTLHDGYQPRPFEQFVSGTVPIVDERLQMRITLGAIPISIVELLTILLPAMMWIFAAIIGWVILARLHLRPLLRVQRAVAAYPPANRHLDLPTLRTPAREHSDQAFAFHPPTKPDPPPTGEPQPRPDDP